MTLKARVQKVESQQDAIRKALLNERDFEQMSQRASSATTDTLTWVRRHTKTFNPHWKEEGRPNPYEPFPDKPYFTAIFTALEAERILWIEKSRDMMVSWACVAFLTLKAMTIPECQVLFQTQTEDKAIRLVDYAKCLYDQQDPYLKDVYRLSKPLVQQQGRSLKFAHGGEVVGIPGGASQIRSYHPWGYLLDEASFVIEAGECYNEALSAVKGKIILNSSAGPGWYADARRDIIRNEA